MLSDDKVKQFSRQLFDFVLYKLGVTLESYVDFNDEKINNAGYMVIGLQLCLRNTLQHAFLNRKIKLNDKNLSNFVNCHVNSFASADIFHRMYVSCAIFAEVALYNKDKCRSKKKRKKLLQKVSHSWFQYFSKHLKRRFEKEGGFGKLYSKAEIVNNVLSEVIQQIPELEKNEYQFIEPKPEIETCLLKKDLKKLSRPHALCSKELHDDFQAINQTEISRLETIQSDGQAAVSSSGEKEKYHGAIPKVKLDTQKAEEAKPLTREKDPCAKGFLTEETFLFQTGAQDHEQSSGAAIINSATLTADNEFHIPRQEAVVDSEISSSSLPDENDPFVENDTNLNILQEQVLNLPLCMRYMLQRLRSCFFSCLLLM